MLLIFVYVFFRLSFCALLYFMVELLPQTCGAPRSMLNILQLLVNASLVSSLFYFSALLFVVRSRSLLSVDPKLNFPSRACDWFKQIFMREQFDYFELGRNNNHVSKQPLHRDISVLLTREYDIVTMNTSSYHNTTVIS